MNAKIYVDLDLVHPVVNGVWHRAALQRMPQSGEAVRMMCGVVGEAEYDRLEHRRTDSASGPPTVCPQCDVIFRRAKGIPVRTTSTRVREQR